MWHWAAFKAADLIERVYGAKIEFDQNIGLMYDSPRAALDLLAADNSFIIAERSPRFIYQTLLSYFSSHLAPPRFDRPCGPQEVESVLCKYASMRAGSYHLGKDIHEVRQALAGWGATAELMLAVMPHEVEFH